MRTGASEELSQHLQELSDNAHFVEGYADHLLTGLRDLQSAASRARSSLDGSESADDIFKDNARELMAMKYELGRLVDSVRDMVRDCENA